jgi:hypothetical protein
MQAKQPLLPARQCRSSLAEATSSGLSMGAKSDSSNSSDSAAAGSFKMPVTVPTASPIEKMLFLKNSLRLTFIFRAVGKQMPVPQALGEFDQLAVLIRINLKRAQCIQAKSILFD